MKVNDIIIENMDHSKDGRAVEELKAALEAKKAQLQDASDDEVYDVIDKIMTRIAKSHGMSGQKLHDMWVDKYKEVPDTWIMEGRASGDHSLHDWFSKSKSSDGTPGWVQIGGKYAGKPCAKQPGQKTKPKCGSSKMKRSMSKKEEESAARRKRQADPNPNRSGKAINVNTKPKNESQELDEACWKGYHQEGMKTMFGKQYPDCRKNKKKKVKESSEASDNLTSMLNSFGYYCDDYSDDGDVYVNDAGEKIARMGSNWKHESGKMGRGADELGDFLEFRHDVTEGAPELLKAEMPLVRRIEKELNQHGYEKGTEEYNKMFDHVLAFHRKFGNAERINQPDIKEEKCPHCAGPMFSEMMINEKKDACYYKVKSRYKVWPSAYASGALVKCRKKGAKNWGTKSESIEEGSQDFNKVEPYEVCLAGKPVKKFDYYQDARRFHDNWKKKLHREGNKEKADKITLNPIMK